MDLRYYHWPLMGKVSAGCLKITWIPISEVLFISILLAGIHAIVKSGSRLSYVVHNVTSGRYEQDSQFPIDINAFLGTNVQNVLLSSTGDVSLPLFTVFDFELLRKYQNVLTLSSLFSRLTCKNILSIFRYVLFHLYE